LFDDITSELDLGHVGRFLNALESVQGQIFFTAIHPQLFQQQLDPQKTSFFTLENGEFV
jgi:recombinational DNA repair ATPase RecF